MQRWLFIVIAAIVLGAVTTVLVAWGYAFQRKLGSGAVGWPAQGMRIEEEDADWSVLVHEQRGERRYLVGEVRPAAFENPTFSAYYRGLTATARSELPRWVAWPDEFDGPTMMREGDTVRPQIVSHAFGWPAPALHGYVVEDLLYTFHHFWLTEPPGSATWGFPIGIIPRGLAVNTAFFSLLWVVLLALGNGALHLVARRNR